MISIATQHGLKAVAKWIIDYSEYDFYSYTCNPGSMVFKFINDEMNAFSGRIALTPEEQEFLRNHIYIYLLQKLSNYAIPGDELPKLKQLLIEGK